ncbi:MAG: hypothetical protein V3R49_04815, partial [Gammaproteobacteria bacterium]
MKSGVLNSLRGRYALVAIIVAVVVVGVAYMSYIKLNDAREQTSENTNARNQLLEHSRLIRDAVWNTRESLAAFLLTPNNTDQQQNIYNFLDNAKTHTNSLLDQSWIIQNDKLASVRTLDNALDKLKLSIDDLVNTRLDMSRQYPALALARASMLPQHKVFYTSAAFAIEEFYEDTPTKLSLRSHQHFVQARHIWTQMISNFRMYLANRLGSFAEQVLGNQEQDVMTQYEDLEKTLNNLQQMDNKDQLGIQGSVSLEELITSSHLWNDTFKNVKRIHNTDNWRADKKLIQDNVKPNMEEI